GQACRVGDAAGAGAPCGGSRAGAGNGTARATAASSAAVRAAVLGVGRRRGNPGTPSAWGRRSRLGGAVALPCGGAVPCGEAGPSEGRRDRKLTQSVAARGDRLQVRHGGGW